MHKIDPLIAICLAVTGVVHIFPLIGVLGSAHLKSLYAIEVHDQSTLLLLQHRAVLFGVLGSALLLAAFSPKFYLAAILVGLVSTLSFVLLSLLMPPLSDPIQRVVAVDVVCVVLLASAALSLLSKDVCFSW